MQIRTEIIAIWEQGDALIRHADFPSRHVTPRHVDIWLPPGYGFDPDARYPVIYMHDGQNLFDPAICYAGVPWDVDGAIKRLMSESGMAGAIIVGIWNSARRWRDYMPMNGFRALHRARKARYLVEQGEPPASDAYLRFMVEELKPFVDEGYRTRPGAGDTFVMGSSLGGLISLYALEAYPDVFGGAGCVSTHWPGGGVRLVDAMGRALPRAGRHRLYFDFGTETLDAKYEPYQQRFDRWMEEAGYTFGRDWLTLKFEGAEHSERSWAERVHIPLRFMLTE
jgi:predicted alpha/beta superfamily hydrolase